MVAVNFTFNVQGGDQVTRQYSLIEKAAEQTANAQIKAAEKAAKAESKARDQAAKASEKAEQKKVRESEKTFKYLDGIRTRFYLSEQKEAEKAANVRIREEKRAAKAIASERSKLYSNIGSLARHGAQGLALSAAALGIGVVAQSIREAGKLQELANRISINARGPGQKGADATEIRKEMQDIAKSSPGIKAEDAAKGLLNYVNLTGDLKTGRELGRTFATVSQASGADMSDVSTTSASLSKQFGLTSEAEQQKAMASMVGIGKTGAMPIDQIAAQFSRIASAGSRFGFTGAKGVNQIAGLVNIARGSTGGPEQAATATEEMLTHITQNAMKLKGQHVNVFKNGKTRDIQDILVDMVKNVGGKNMALKQIKMQELLGVEGSRAAAGLQTTYANTFRDTKGTDKEKVAAGEAAVRSQLNDAINNQTTWSDVQKDAAQAQQDMSAQVTSAWESLKAAITGQALPAFAQLAPKLLTLVPLLEPLGTVFAALAESGGLVVDLFKEIGSIKPHEDTPQEKVKKAERNLKDFNNQLAQTDVMGTPTLDQLNQRSVLEKAVEDAKDSQYETPRERQKIKNQTDSEFATEFANASGYEPGSAKYEAAKRDGAQIAGNIEKDPNSVNNSDYNPEQTKQVQGRIEQTIANHAKATDTAASSLKAFTTAVNAATAAAVNNRNAPINHRK